MRRFDANPVFLFTLTLFTSATLLFLVEPMIAKMILPKFGGTPAVWATCMVFFQAELLAGYAYAHAAATYLKLRTQIVFQVGLVGLAVLLLPLLRLSVAWEPPGEGAPALWVLLLLTGALGLPFFVMSTSAPLLQSWFSESGHPSAKDPYFLYAASNVGSMMTLLLYPVVVEPWFTIPIQNYLWMIGYVFLLGLVAWCGHLVWNAPVALKSARARKLEAVPPAGEAAAEANGDAEGEEAPEESVAITAEAPADKAGKRKKRGWRDAITRKPPIKPVMPAVEKSTPPEPETELGALTQPRSLGPLPSEPDADRPGFWKQVHWCALAFVPSSLMLGVTTYMTTDIASLPLLWIIPLALYLLTFIIVFSRVPPIVHQAMVLLMPVMVLLLIFVMLIPKPPAMEWQFATHLATLFVVSMVCHGELARNRPPARYLTGFYLCMSIGGTLGGVFNALVAPVVFLSVSEYRLVIVFSCMLLPALLGDTLSKLNRYLDIGLASALGVAAIYATYKLYGETTIQQMLDVTGFPHLWEQLFVVVVVGGAMLAYALLARKGQQLNRWLDIGLPLALGILTLQLIKGSPFINWDLSWITGAPMFDPLTGRHTDKQRQMADVLTFGLPVALCYGFAEQPIRFALGVGAILLAGVFNPKDERDTIFRDRSFFGVLRVEALDPYATLPWQDGTVYNRLLHGTTLHGMQRQPNLPLLLLPLTATNPLDAAALTSYGRQKSDALRMDALTYYHRTGPIGQIYSTFCPPGKPCNVAFIGLGTGTMSSYLEPEHHGDIYEIDQKVVDIASNPNFFTYLHDRQGRYEIRLGDARLKLKNAAPHSYKLIVVDAFSSDAIPVHLITKEAIELYFEKLSEDGVLAVHISNRHLHLGPVLGNIARELGLAGLDEYDNDDSAAGKNSSDWVLLARNRDVLKPLLERRRATAESVESNLVLALIGSKVMVPAPYAQLALWDELADDPEQRTWTDDYSNIIGVLRWWKKNASKSWFGHFLQHGQD